ncbi:MAG: MBL fold metallo-hydrolase, partial [Oscillospiraceae bacterium]|nr:MBL fold metallo-hydrolase [Oscillospiraceae bacterium]
QGSCSHIKTPGGENIMIDCGVSKYYSKDDVGRYVAEPYLDSNGVTHLDYAILTHYHDDHFSGLLSLMQDGMVDVLILPKLKNNDDYEVYNTLKETAILNDVDINYFSRGSTLLLDDAKITVLSPSKNDYWEQNSESLVLKLTYKNSGFLFTGDIENDVMKTLKPEELVSDVIQSPHHGSNTSDLDLFYKNTQADYSVISAGKGNSYNHPHKEHIDALLSNGIKILRTDQNGTVYFKVDKKGNIKYKVEEGAK